MNWNSPAEFFAMGGYALYVWGSVAACAAAVGIEIAAVRMRRRAALRVLRRRAGIDCVEMTDLLTIDYVELPERVS